MSVQLTAPKADSVNGAPVTTSGSAHATGFQPVIAWIKADILWGKTGSAPPLPKPVAICGPAPGADKPGTPCQGGSDVTFTNAPTPQPAMNGPFQLIVTAHADDGFGQPAEGSDQVRYGLNIPPPPVGDVKAAVDTKSRETTVSWIRDAATPDVQAYYVYRKGPGDPDFKAVVQTPQLTSGERISVLDQGTQYKGGEYVYQVETRRNGASGDGSTTVVSDRTKSQSNKVTVAEPPPGTPTTLAPPQNKGSGAPPTVRGTPSGVNRNSGFSGSGSSSAATTPTSEAVTPDPGFVRGLPYAGSQPGDEGEGNNSAVAVTPGRHSSNRRGILAPVAGGAILFLGALHLRIFKKRLDEPIGLA